LAALKADIDKGLNDMVEGRVKDFAASRMIERGRKLLAARSPSARPKRRKPTFRNLDLSCVVSHPAKIWQGREAGDLIATIKCRLEEGSIIDAVKDLYCTYDAQRFT
jgi:hypothetical protein